MKRRCPSASAGFTLIELMTVVGIVGVLATIAMPEYGRMMVRSKMAERETLVKRIQQGVEDVYLRMGQIPASARTGARTPATPGSMKQVANWNQAGWREIFGSFQDIDGAVYYSYQYAATEPAGTLQIDVYGDLDGNGNQTHKIYFYQRTDGAYQQTLPAPGDPDPEDFGVF
jgi:type IV pilus assembly protein PilA